MLKKTENGKPYIDGMKNFSIAHSGTVVIVAFSLSVIGADIELKQSMDITGIVDFLHPMEKKTINRNKSSLTCFFRIWTRKEAFHKARGDGITNGLNKYNCLENIINDGKQKWNIVELDFLENYAIAVCQNAPIKDISLREIRISDLLL